MTISRSVSSASGPPLIGVTTSEVRTAESVNPTPEGEPPRREMALGLTYLKALEAAGALPVVIPPLDLNAIESLLDRFDGICLSGGPDLDPETYGAEPHPDLGPVEPDLDRFELAIAGAADRRGVPLFAICRGTQALNIVRGGTLHQHIPERAGDIGHRQTEAGDVATHDVSIAPDSRLAEILGTTELDVNSFHHQAIDRVGDGLVVTAKAPDGEVEAVEDPSRDFLLGVQWHAETMVHRSEDCDLFRSFVEASAAHRDAHGDRTGAVV